MNFPKIEFIAYINNFYKYIQYKNILNLRIKTVLYLKYNLFNGLVGGGTASLNTDSQWSKEEASFARATQVWLAVNHNISIDSGEWVRCSKRIAWASELGSRQSKFV